MPAVTLLDAITVLAWLAAILGIYLRWRTALGVCLRPVFLGLCAFSTLYSVCLLSSSTERFPQLKLVQDVAGATLPVWWLLAVFFVEHHIHIERIRRHTNQQREIFNQSFQLMGMLSTDGRVLIANDAALELVGDATSRNIGRFFWESDWWAPSPELKETVRTAVHRVAAGEFVRFETNYPGDEQQVRTFDFSMRPMRDPDGSIRAILAEARDITQLKKAEEDARQADRALRTLIQNLPGFVYRCNNDRNWTMQHLEGAVEETTGYAPEYLIGNNKLAFNDLITEEYRDPLWKLWQEKLSRREPLQTEYTIRTRDGSIKWVWERGRGVYDNDGNLLSIEGFIFDISERVRAEQTAKETTERLRLAMHASHMGVWEWNLERNRVIWSPETLKIFGVSADEFAGTYEAYLEFVSPESRPEVTTFIKQFLANANESSVIQFEHEIVRRNGTRGWIEVRGTTFVNQHNQPNRMTGVCVDITARKRAEAERHELESQLRQAQKLEAVGQLAGGVAHDFNNILTAILGNVELSMESLRNALGTEHDAVHSMEQIEVAAQRASALTRQLLAFSRRDVTQPQALSLNRTLAGLDKMLRRLITENIELKLVTDPNLRSVWADPGRMEQVIVNLVVNAVHAMPNGGSLTLDTQNVMLDDDYARSHTEARPGPHVLLTVSDTGHGMDAATRERIFEPFFTTKSADKGTGLGLASVHGIVKQSDGHIVVSSAEGLGTTFKVYLPATDHAPAAQPLSTRTPGAPGGDETILLCEDDPPVRDLIGQALRSGGYNVITASRADEAIATVAAHAGPLNLLVTDVIMPDMNGRDLSQRIRDLRPGLQTLFISGYTSNVIAHHGVLDDGVEFLEKPFTRQELLRKVRAVLDKTATTS